MTELLDTLAAYVEQIGNDKDKLQQFVNGTAGETVTTDSGEIPTLAGIAAAAGSAGGGGPLTIEPWDMTGAITGIPVDPANNYNATVNQSGSESQIVPSLPLPDAGGGTYLSFLGTVAADFTDVQIPINVGSVTGSQGVLACLHPASMSTSDAIAALFANDFSQVLMLQGLVAAGEVYIAGESSTPTGIAIGSGESYYLSVNAAGGLTLHSDQTNAPFTMASAYPGDISNSRLSFGIYCSTASPTVNASPYAVVGQMADAELPNEAGDGDHLKVTAPGQFGAYTGRVGDIVKVVSDAPEGIVVWRMPEEINALTKEQADAFYDAKGAAAAVEASLEGQVEAATDQAGVALSAALGLYPVHYTSDVAVPEPNRMYYTSSTSARVLLPASIPPPLQPGQSFYLCARPVQALHGALVCSGGAAGDVRVNGVRYYEDGVIHELADFNELVKVTYLGAHDYALTTTSLNTINGPAQGLQDFQTELDLNAPAKSKTMRIGVYNLSGAPRTETYSLPVFTSAEVNQERRILAEVRSDNSPGAYSLVHINFHDNGPNYGAVFEILAYPPMSSYKYSQAEFGITAKYGGTAANRSRHVITYTGETVLPTGSGTGRTLHGHREINLKTLDSPFVLSLSEHGPLHPYDADGNQNMVTEYVRINIAQDMPDLSLNSGLGGTLISNGAFKRGDIIFVAYMPNGAIELQGIIRGGGMVPFVPDADTSDGATTASSIDAIRDALVDAGIMSSA